MTALYPISLKKLWKLLSALPEKLTADELDKFVFDYLKTSNYRHYIRMLKHIGFISGDYNIDVYKVKNFSEFANKIYNYLAKHGGKEILSAIKDLSDMSLSTSPNSIKRFLEKKGLKISTYKIRIIMRYFSSIGVIVRSFQAKTIGVVNLEELMLNILKINTPLTIFDLVKKIEKQYGYARGEILKVLCKKIFTNKKIYVEAPHDLENLVKLIREKIILFDCEKLELNLSDLSENEIDVIKKIAKRYKNLIKVTDKSITLNEEIFKLINIYYEI